MTKRIRASIFLGLCALLGLFAVQVDVGGPAKSDTVVVEAADWTPSDGFRSGGKCYENHAFSGVAQVPCSRWHPLPKPVRQCAAAVIIAGIGAYLTGNPVIAAGGTTAGGCLANVF